MRRAALGLALVAAACPAPRPRDPPLELFAWERGLAVRARGSEPMPMYLWFYEWNLFGAREAGDLSAGRWDFAREIAPDGGSGRIRGDGIELAARVEDDGVALELTIENQSDRDWPEQASIVACFNPGPKESRTFEMGHHRKTYLLGEDGLVRFADRAMHFDARARPRLAELSPELEFAFSERWPTSAQDAHAGLLLRESLGGGWTAGVAWEDWLAVQAHNPWLCLHVATKVGPLARGERRVVRGRLWLFPGDAAEGLRRFRGWVGGLR
jgi:hypothetical protein